MTARQHLSTSASFALLNCCKQPWRLLRRRKGDLACDTERHVPAVQGNITGYNPLRTYTFIHAKNMYIMCVCVALLSLIYIGIMIIVYYIMYVCIYSSIATL